MYGVEHRRRGRIFAGLAALSGLAGCAQTEVAVATRDPSQPVLAAGHTAVASRVKRPISGSGDAALDVIGFDQDQIEARLGPAAQAWAHLPAMEAIFNKGGCTLDVTFYPDIRTRVYRALAYKVVGNVDTVEERRRCSAIFAAQLRGKPAVGRTAHRDGAG
jgi:hypothetical protein